MCCHKCGAHLREGAKFCTRCGTHILPPQSERSGEPSGYVSVFQHPPQTSEKEPLYTPPPGFRREPYYPAIPTPRATGGIVEERDIALSVVLTLITCGVYAPIWLYLIGRDLRYWLGTGEPKPGLDIFLTIVTCGIWAVYVFYRYSTLINDVKQNAGMRKTDLPTISLLLALFGYVTLFLPLVGLGLMQSELNKVHRRLRGERH